MNILSFDDACAKYSHVNMNCLSTIYNTFFYTIDCLQLYNYLTIEELQYLINQISDYKKEILHLVETSKHMPNEVLSKTPIIFNSYEFDVLLMDLYNTHYHEIT